MNVSKTCLSAFFARFVSAWQSIEEHFVLAMSGLGYLPAYVEIRESESFRGKANTFTIPPYSY